MRGRVNNYFSNSKEDRTGRGSFKGLECRRLARKTHCEEIFKGGNLRERQKLVTNLDLTAILIFKTWISFSRQKSHLEFVNRVKAVFWRKYFEKSIQQENKGYPNREGNQTWTRIAGGWRERTQKGIFLLWILGLSYSIFQIISYLCYVLVITRGHIMPQKRPTT